MQLSNYQTATRWVLPAVTAKKKKKKKKKSISSFFCAMCGNFDRLLIER